MHFSPPADGHLPKQLRVINRGARGELNNPRLIRPAGVQRIRDSLGNRHLMQDITQLVQRGNKVGGVLGYLRHQRQHGSGVLVEDSGHQVQDSATVHGAEHLGNLGADQLAFTVGNRLIRETQRVAHGSFCRARNQSQRLGVCLHRLSTQNVLQVRDNLLGLHVLEVELQTAGQHRRRQLLRVSGGQQEHGVRRRLLEGFQQGIEAVVRQHVHLVDQINFVTGVRRRVLHVLQQLTGVLHFCLGGRIDFNQIN